MKLRHNVCYFGLYGGLECFCEAFTGSQGEGETQGWEWEWGLFVIMIGDIVVSVMVVLFWLVSDRLLDGAPHIIHLQ